MPSTDRDLPDSKRRKTRLSATNLDRNMDPQTGQASGNGSGPSTRSNSPSSMQGSAVSSMGGSLDADDDEDYQKLLRRYCLGSVHGEIPKDAARECASQVLTCGEQLPSESFLRRLDPSRNDMSLAIVNNIRQIEQICAKLVERDSYASQPSRIKEKWCAIMEELNNAIPAKNILRTVLWNFLQDAAQMVFWEDSSRPLPSEMMAKFHEMRIEAQRASAD